MHSIFKLLHHVILVFIEFHPVAIFLALHRPKGCRVWKTFERRGLHSDIFLFPPQARRDFFSSPPYLPHRFTSNASTYFTSGNLEKKIRSRGRWVAVYKDGKKWIIPHLSFATSLSNFYPFDFLRSTG